jgi:enoyl-CoA hydratase/carnithine racemase
MEMRDIIERVSHDGNIRCIVLSSALDKFFTAGLDREFTHGSV